MPKTPAGSRLFGALDAKSVSNLVGAASDIALVMDEHGTILDVMSPVVQLPARELRLWRGRPWTDTVTSESRQKVEALLRDAQAAADKALARWRQVNHPIEGTDDLPVMYSTVRLQAEGAAAGAARIVAIGRDLSNVVAVQRRLVETQQAMERDYWRFREAETRYRHLFETSSEAVLIVDGAHQRVVEANPVARTLCASTRARLAGAPLATLFETAHAARIQDLLAAARSIGRQSPALVRLVDGQEVSVSASAFRQDDATFALVRLSPTPAAAEQPPRGARAARNGRDVAAAPKGGSPAGTGPWQALLEGFIENSPDGFVFCDAEGKVRRANRAFLSLAQLSSEEQARGQSLERWVGRTGVEMGVLMGNLRQRGSVGLFQTLLRGEYGAGTEIEIAGSQLPDPAGPVLAFAVRDVERRPKPIDGAAGAPTLQRSAAELAELVGRTPLKEIVAETTDLIEQLCIQTALTMTGDNRASAAQLLGLSRQSLYVKLRRYGLSDGDAEE